MKTCFNILIYHNILTCRDQEIIFISNIYLFEDMHNLSQRSSPDQSLLFTTTILSVNVNRSGYMKKTINQNRSTPRDDTETTKGERKKSGEFQSVTLPGPSTGAALRG